MTQTLFSQVQGLFERTYSVVGFNLETCLIGPERCHALTQLAGPLADDLNPAARTFLRSSGRDLHLAIYYSPGLIERLEREDPRRVLSEYNIHALIMFVEELNHAVHASLCFLRGEAGVEGEAFARNLELQGQVDTYLLLLFFTAGLRGCRRVPPDDRAWLKDRLFTDQSADDYLTPQLRERYRETRQSAALYTDYLDTIEGLPRLAEVRAFHRLDYAAKLDRVREVTLAIAP